MFDKAKTLLELKKIQSALAKEIIETDAGDGAVRVTINGEQKIQKVSISPDRVDLDDIEQLERWIQSAITQAITKSQQAAAERMKSVAGRFGLPGM